VLHRGANRCCNTWCGPKDARRGWAQCTAGPIPEAPVLVVEGGGKVVGRLLAGALYRPHSLAAGRDGASFFVSDLILDQVRARARGGGGFGRKGDEGGGAGLRPVSAHSNFFCLTHPLLKTNHKLA
jgi:hypothetical protein